jgi:hypothetical protein
MNEPQEPRGVLSINYYSYVTLSTFNIIGCPIETNKQTLFSNTNYSYYIAGRMIIEQERKSQAK